MSETFRERYPAPWRIDELSSGYRVVSSNGYTLAWIYSAEGIERSADPERLTHSEALVIARAIAMFVNGSHEDRLFPSRGSLWSTTRKTVCGL
jgi:hypothetical protein